MKQHVLIGMTITGIDLSASREAIRFHINGLTHSIVARCSGDCCSHTWIEDVINPDAILNSPVLAVTDLNLPDTLCGKTRHADKFEDEMAYYGCAIDTAKGRCVLAYRNSSNGYYGGSLDWPYDASAPYGSDKETWTPVAETING